MLGKGLIFILTFQQIVGQSSIGDQCVLRHDRSQGICRNNNRCPIVNDLLRCKRIRPTVCGFDGNQPVVCCPTNRVDLGNCGSSQPSPITERISIRKCKEYKNCDSRRPPDSHSIVGGIETNNGEFPHMAAIGWALVDGSGYAWNCGGTLVSSNYVLSAAHCTYVSDTSVQTPQPSVVRLGEHNLVTPDESRIQDIGIAAIINNPNYKPPNKYHDIALLRLSRSAVFGPTVRPACLWQTANIASKTAIATGWGKIGFTDGTSDTLQKVELSIIDKTTCANFYNNYKRRLPNGIINEQMCAGDLRGGKDTCQGDSGGPLQIVDSQAPCVYHLIGITSFGIGCGGKDSPAVYTRISSYVDWIESIVWPQ